jgi:hypothetical protein
MLVTSAPLLTMLARCRTRQSINRSKIAIDMKREHQALIYTILIEDKPIVAIEAGGSEARELCKEEWFLEELSVLKMNGEPLYRPGLRIRTRPAIEEEWVRYDEACSAGDDAEDIVFVYLVGLDRE